LVVVKEIFFRKRVIRLVQVVPSLDGFVLRNLVFIDSLRVVLGSEAIKRIPNEGSVEIAVVGDVKKLVGFESLACVVNLHLLLDDIIRVHQPLGDIGQEHPFHRPLCVAEVVALLRRAALAHQDEEADENSTAL